MGKKRKKKRIRPLALCVFQREGMIFVARGYDAHKDETFYRPVGGRIEFGERGRDAVVREVREELNAEATDVTYLGALENIFSYENAPGHEIALIYDGRFTDPALNADDVCVQGRDGAKDLVRSLLAAARFFSKAALRRLFIRKACLSFLRMRASIRRDRCRKKSAARNGRGWVVYPFRLK